MKIPIKEILVDHFKETGEYVTLKMLAEEMTDKGIFKNIHSAQNMIYYNYSGKAKSADQQLVLFLHDRFNVPFEKIVIWER